MTNYEHLMERMRYCEDVAAKAADARIAKFHEGAAKGFYDRAMAMTLEEAAMEADR